MFSFIYKYMRNNSSANFQFPSEPLNPNRNAQSRSMHHRPILNHLSSPRDNKEVRFNDSVSSSRDLGDQMRFMKSRMGNNNISLSNMDGVSKMGENNLFPPQLLFLLKNEDGNMTYMSKMVESEKLRVERDFQNFSKEIMHQIHDLKLSIHSQIELVYRDFIAQYRDLKQHVTQLRQTRRIILETHPNNDYHQRNYGHTSPRANINKGRDLNQNSNIVSNLNLLQEISRDEEYFKNHRLYEEITSAHSEAMGPIMSIAHDIIAIGSQAELYKNQIASTILRDLRNSFYQHNQAVYENELEKMVVSTREILEDNNALLKGLNIDDGRSEKEENFISKAVSNNNYSRPKSSNPNLINETKRYDIAQSQAHQENPYGIPSFKSYNNNNNNIKEENNRPHNILSSNTNSNRYGRPVSNSLDHNQYFSSQTPKSKNNVKNSFEDERSKYSYNVVKATSEFKVTRDQQSAVVPMADNIRLVADPKSMISVVECNEAQEIILCAVFINGGRNLALGSKDHNIYVYSTANGSFITKLHGHQASICSLANFGEFFASGGDKGCGSLFLWSPVEWRMKNRVSLHVAALTCIVDLLDGNHLVTGGYDKQIFVYNYRKKEVTYEVKANKSQLTAMVLCSQGSRLVTAGLDSNLSIWSIVVTSGQVERIVLEKIMPKLDVVSILRPLTLSSEYFLAGNRLGKIFLINAAIGEIVKSVSVGNGSVLELVAIERMNKPESPLVLSMCNNERSLMMTKMDTGISFSLGTEESINMSFGCGIGPKMVIDNSGVMAIASQSPIQKEARLYSIQTIHN